MTAGRAVVLILIDAVAWFVIQAGAGLLVHRIPTEWLAADRGLLRARQFEDGGRFYVRVLRIKRWKGWLPEAGDLFAGGFNKARLREHNTAYLERYAIETRRAELGHWLAMLPAPIFLLWNPWYAAALMPVYAVAVNGPCIASQRYNRLRIQRLLARRQGS